MCPCQASSKPHLTCCIKQQQVFILWHLNTSPDRQQEKVEQRGDSWQLLNEGTADPCLLHILLQTPVQQRSSTPLLQQLQTWPSRYESTKSLCFQGVMYLAPGSHLPARPASPLQCCSWHLCSSLPLCHNALLGPACPRRGCPPAAGTAAPGRTPEKRAVTPCCPPVTSGTESCGTTAASGWAPSCRSASCSQLQENYSIQIK